MEKEIAIADIEQVVKQRNLFLTLTLLLALAMLGLVFKLLKTEEKIVLVPGLNQEVWTKSNAVSKSYLEEVTFMFLPLLLDLNPEIISHKANTIFMYIAQDNPDYMKRMQDYFANAKSKYSQFALSTYFSVKNLEIDSKALVVIANGTLTSRYGDKGFETSRASYRLSYQWLGGKLRLQEFVRLKNEKELEIEALKLKQQNEAAHEDLQSGRVE